MLRSISSQKHSTYNQNDTQSCHTAELPYVFQAMDVIRSNYSTLGPLAQREAPKPPEFPYTEIMNAYRGAFEANLEDQESTLSENNSTKKESGRFASVQNHTHTKAFQRIIDHFFGDYFTVDVDEELASDMAERWSAFAREGSPNYDASKTEWRSWRHRPRMDMNEVSGKVDSSHIDTNRLDSSYEDDFWNIPGEYDEFTSNPDVTDYFFSDTEEGYTDIEDIDVQDDTPPLDINSEYRRRALEALKLEVADNSDVFRTELRYIQDREGDKLSRENFFFRKMGWNYEEKVEKPGKRRSMQEILWLARRMGVIGLGVNHDDSNRGPPMGEEAFFPHLFELSWPPELRLIEEDCTCDMWDRIRCKYKDT